jgi:hypothetical protein
VGKVEWKDVLSSYTAELGVLFSINGQLFADWSRKGGRGECYWITTAAATKPAIGLCKGF